jgi:hypothetical protein
MRWIIFTVLFLGFNSGIHAQTSDPLCVLDAAQTPMSWRPPAALQQSLSPAPWSESEANDAQAAIASGLDEMIGYFNRNPSAVRNLWDDSIEALIQVTHSSANEPQFDAKARDAARSNLTTLLTSYVDLDPDWVLCEEFDELLPATIFAHKLYSDKDTLKDVITKRTNAAFRDCGSLEAAIEIDFQTILAEKGKRPDNMEDLFDLYLWSLWLTEAELYPDIKLPVEARTFGPEAWKYFQAYRLVGASSFEDGARDEDFIRIASLATRLAHIPSGIQRFPLHVEDKPDLYRFYRENFYPVMQSGDLSLLASFVDSLRQYGCTAENDMQVRDGSRHLLEAYRGSNNKWMNYRKEDGTDDDPDDHDLIQLPWKAMLGLRGRQLEEPKPGTYGGIVRRWLPQPN